MAFNWYLGDFLTGQLVRATPLPFDRQSGSIRVDIHSEDDATVTIPLGGLSEVERNDWHDTFAELRRFLVLADDSKAWSHPSAVLFAGFINKITPKIKPHVVELQLTSLWEYTKARIVGETWGQTITDPTKAITFEAGTWQGVMNAAIKRMFDNSAIPTNVPKNPVVLGTVGDSTGTGRKKTVLLTDAQTYGEVLDEISETDSGLGLEYRFVPRWTSASKTSVVWDFVTGTEEAPHIGVATSVPLWLSEDGEKFSAWDTTIDSNELYSGLYLQSKGGDEEKKSGADYTGSALPATQFPILVERFFNPGVELSEGQVAEQLQARLSFAGKSKYTAGFTVEEQGSPWMWLSRLGNTLQVMGLPDTYSAGHSADLRCVGVSFTPGTGTVSIDVMQKQPVYPRLPRKRLKDSFNKKDKKTIKPNKPATYTYNVRSTSATTLSFSTTDPRVRSVFFTTSNGNVDYSIAFRSEESPKTWTAGGPIGAGTVTAKFYDENNKWLGEGTWDLIDFGGKPDDGFGVDGVLDPDSLWGDEGRNPWDGMPSNLANATLTGFVENTYDYPNSPGIMSLDPTTITQSESNRLYGLSHSTEGFASNNTTHYNGGVSWETGMPLEGFKPFYIKKLHMNANGTMGEMVEVGVISEEKIKSMLQVWKAHEGIGPDGYYMMGVRASHWIVKNRYYFCLGHLYAISEIPTVPTPSNVWNHKYLQHGKVSVISTSIDSKTGLLGTEWKSEGIAFPGEVFPLTSGISRYGSVVTFSLLENMPSTFWKDANAEEVNNSLSNSMTLGNHYKPRPIVIGELDSYPPSAISETGAKTWYNTREVPEYRSPLQIDFDASTLEPKTFKSSDAMFSWDGMWGTQPKDVKSSRGWLYSVTASSEFTKVEEKPGGIETDAERKLLNLYPASRVGVALGHYFTFLFTNEYKGGTVYVGKIVEDGMDGPPKELTTLPAEIKNFLGSLNQSLSTFFPELYSPITPSKTNWPRFSRIFSYGGRLFYIVADTRDTNGRYSSFKVRSVKAVEVTP